VTVQWVQMGAGVLVASERDVVFQRATLGALAPRRPMPDWLEATVESTRRLLDGAIALAERNNPAQEAPAPTGPRWIWQLTNQWYCAHHSVALLASMIDRYGSVGREDLRAFARLKYEEEVGHDEFPRRDLERLGYDVHQLAETIALAPPMLAALEYARSELAGAEPVTALGYVYALERQVLRLTKDSLAALEAQLPFDSEVTTGLRLHTEFDVDHVNDAIRFIASLPAHDRARVVIGTHRTVEIYAQPFTLPTDAELDSWLSNATNQTQTKEQR